MKQQENDGLEFTLEDIIREFGSHSQPDTPPEEDPDEQPEDVESPEEAEPPQACSAPEDEPAEPPEEAPAEEEEAAPAADDAPVEEDEESLPVSQPPAAEEAPEPAPVKSDDTQKFSLTAIWRKKPRKPEKIQEEPPAAPEPVESDTVRFDVSELQAEAPEPESAPDDTIRFDADQLPEEAPQEADDTLRLDPQDLQEASEQAPAEPDLSDTQPLDTEALSGLHAEIPAREADDDEQTEPFSQDWEPEYEEPIGDYTPPQPIVFKPRSRLQELKQKLVAGPERRYYELMEVGLTGLQAAIFLSFLVLILSCGALVLYSMGLVQPERMRLLVFGEVLTMLLATLLGSYQLMSGLASLFRGRVTPDTILFFTLIACCVDSFFCLKTLRVPYCAAFCLEMTVSLIAEYHRRNTEMGQMDTLRKAVTLSSIVKVPDFYDGRPGLLRSEGQVEDFMDHYQEPSRPQKNLSRYLVILLIASVITGGAVALIHGYHPGIQALTASLLAGLPATCFVTLSRPAAVLERKLHKVGAVICGWNGMKELSRPATVPLSDPDLFPVGSVKMNGMKFFGSRDPDEIIAYVTALVTASGGGLSPLFQQALDSRNGRHYEVASFQIYAAGGLGGEVNGEPVLVGTQALLHDMGVEIPEGTRVNQALYAAVDGELCGVFAVTYNRTRSASAGLGTLTSYRNLTPVLTCGDFMLTEGFLRKKFNVNTRRIAFPAQNIRQTLAARQPEEDAQGLALFTRADLASYAFAITGAKALRSASILGVVTHIIAGSVGLAVVAILACIGHADLISPDHLMLFELLWMIPGFLITEWTRTV